LLRWNIELSCPYIILERLEPENEKREIGTIKGMIIKFNGTTEVEIGKQGRPKFHSGQEV